MLPSMGPIMSSMPILEPAEAMETDVPLEEVFMMLFVYRLLCCVIIVCVISVSFYVYCGVQGEVCADYDVFQDVVISNVSQYECVMFL